MGDPIKISIELVDKISGGLGKILGVTLEAHDSIAKMRAQLDGLAGSKAAGGTVIKMLSDMREQTGMTREELAPLAKQLLAMGTPIDQMRAKTLALASVMALDLKGGTAAYLKVQRSLAAELVPSTKSLAALSKAGISNAEVAQAMGKSLKDFNSQLKQGKISGKEMAATMDKLVTSKGAEALAAKAKSFDSAIAILKESIGDLFADIDTKPIIAEIKALIKEFGPGTKAGKELRKEIGDAFAKIGAAAKAAGPVVLALLKGIPTWGPPAVAALVALELAAAPMAAPFIAAAAAVALLNNALEENADDQVRIAKIAHENEFGEAKAKGMREDRIKHLERERVQAYKTLKAGIDKDKARGADPKFIAEKKQLANQLLGDRDREIDALKKSKSAKDVGEEGKIEADAQSGKAAGEAYADGLASTAGKAEAAGSAVAGAGHKGLDKKDEVGSPPKAYVRRGQAAAKAYAEGFADLDVSSTIARGTSAHRGAARAGRGGAGGKVIHVNFAEGAIQVNGAGQDAAELSEHMLAVAMERIALSRGLG